MNKALIKVWKKMKLWEVSACGIPMYPKAHKSFSLVKALQASEDLVSDELNLEDKPMENSETSESEKPEEEEKEDSESESEEPSEVEETKEETSAETPEPKEEPKGDSVKAAKLFQDAIVKGFKTAIKESQTERGLISQEIDLNTQMKEELNKKSIGELAVMSGFFQRPPMMGESKEI